MGSGSMGYLTQIWHTINNAKTVKFADTKSRTRDLLITNSKLCAIQSFTFVYGDNKIH